MLDLRRASAAPRPSPGRPRRARSRARRRTRVQQRPDLRRRLGRRSGRRPGLARSGTGVRAVRMRMSSTAASTRLPLPRRWPPPRGGSAGRPTPASGTLAVRHEPLTFTGRPRTSNTTVWLPSSVSTRTRSASSGDEPALWANDPAERQVPERRRVRGQPDHPAADRRRAAVHVVRAGRRAGGRPGHQGADPGDRPPGLLGPARRRGLGVPTAQRPEVAVSVPAALRTQPRLISRSSNRGPQLAAA